MTRLEQHHLPGQADVVVLSPHLDDAALAVGALIARLAAAGRRVEVWTAFTAQPDLARVPRSQRVFGDYRTRLTEDDRAMDRLGAARRRLDLPERIWRQPPVGSLAAAFHTPGGLDGFGELAALTDLIAQRLARRDTHVYAPLGVGHHSDHLELALATLLAATRHDAWGRVSFYEDYYALSEALRRRHPVTTRHRWPAHRSPGWVTPPLGLTLRALTVIMRGPGLDDYLPAVQTMRWRCHPATAAGFEAVKLAAVAEYRSQTARLGGMRQLRTAIRHAHRHRGGELLWSAEPAAPTPPS